MYQNQHLTEPITTKLNQIRSSFLLHPLFNQPNLPDNILHEFALYQYSDSILWVPMLSLLKSIVSAPRLLQAIKENIACETGLNGVSHIDLARRMARSLGLKSLRGKAQLKPISDPTQRAWRNQDFEGPLLTDCSTWYLSDEFAALDENWVAGWLLVAETLVPLMFSKMLPYYSHLDCETRYLVEHMDVDSDEHSVWMQESVDELLTIHGEKALKSILAGMNEAAIEAVDVPDLLWDEFARITKG